MDPVLLDVRPALPDPSVTADELSTRDLVQGAVHAHEEDIQSAEQRGQVLAPGGL